MHVAAGHELWIKVMLSVLAALAIHTCIKFSIKKGFAAYSTKSIAAQVGTVWLYGIMAFAIMVHYCKQSSTMTTTKKSVTTTSLPEPLFNI